MFYCIGEFEMSFTLWFQTIFKSPRESFALLKDSAVSNKSGNLQIFKRVVIMKVVADFWVYKSCSPSPARISVVRQRRKYFF